MSEIRNQSPDYRPRKLSLEDDKIIKLDGGNKLQQTPRGNNGNLDQFLIDNSPQKDHKAVFITEFMMLSSEDCSQNEEFLQQNKVTHILNAAGDVIPNVFDPMLMNDQAVKQILNEEGLENSNLFGKI